MQIREMPMLSSNQPVREALVHVKLPGQAVLFQHGDEVRLLKASQIRRFAKDNFTLKELPLESSEGVFQASKSLIDQYLPYSTVDPYSSTPHDLMSILGQRLVLVRKPGMNYLISASEDYLVDYYCVERHHPWRPPPPWTPATTCWCGHLVQRDG